MRRSCSLGFVLAATLSLGACIGNAEVVVPDAVAGAQVGGTLTVGVPRPQTIDPTAVDRLDAAAVAVVSTICDRLVELDPLTGEAVPGLAESWIVSDGGRRINLTLRRGIRFHNGQELRAEDVVFSLSRLADRDFAAPSHGLMRVVAGYDRVHGDAEVGEASERSELQGVRVVNPYAVEILLTTAVADFVRALAHPATAPVPRDAARDDPDGFADRPVCTGPYQLAEEWDGSGEVIRVERFPDYHGANTAYTGGGAGYVDSVEFHVLGDGADRLRAFRQGDVDVTTVDPDASLASIDSDELVPVSTPTLEYVGLPVSTEPFDVRAVRIALSQSLDRQAIVDRVFDGRREPATTVFPAALSGYRRAVACGDHTPVGGDVASARQRLAEADIDLAGQTVKLYFNDEFGHRELMEELGRQWAEAFGVEIQLEPMIWDAYVAAARQAPGLDGPFRMAWAPEYISSDGYLGPMFESTSISSDNFARFQDAQFDRMITEDARRAVVLEDHVAVSQQLEDVVCGEMPIIPIAWGARLHLIDRDRVAPARGSFGNVATGVVDPRELFLPRKGRP